MSPNRLAAYALAVVVAGSFLAGWFRIGSTWILLGIGVLAVLAALVAASVYLSRELAERRRQKAEPIDEWVLELDSRDLAVLTNSVWTDQFWKNFDVVSLVEPNEQLFDQDLWLRCRFTFRHRLSGRRPGYGICGSMIPSKGSMRVSMRGLW